MISRWIKMFEGLSGTSVEHSPDCKHSTGGCSHGEHAPHDRRDTRAFDDHRCLLAVLAGFVDRGGAEMQGQLAAVPRRLDPDYVGTLVSA